MCQSSPVRVTNQQLSRDSFRFLEPLRPPVTRIPTSHPDRGSTAPATRPMVTKPPSSRMRRASAGSVGRWSMDSRCTPGEATPATAQATAQAAHRPVPRNPRCCVVVVFCFVLLFFLGKGGPKQMLADWKPWAPHEAPPEKNMGLCSGGEKKKLVRKRSTTRKVGTSYPSKAAPAHVAGPVWPSPSGWVRFMVHVWNFATGKPVSQENGLPQVQS